MRMASQGFHEADYVLFSLVLTISLAVGVYYSCTGQKQSTTSEYFVANKKMHPVPVAISIFMSYISGVLVMGNTAEMYTAGVQFWLAAWGSVLAFIFSAVVLVPFFYQLNLVSSFEYYDIRFGSKVCRLWASIMFLLSSIVYMGLAMYTPATALNAVTGFPVWASIVACGLVASVYTSMGGIKAVVWTDTIQGFILIAGVIAVFIIGLTKVGGMNTVWEVSREGDRLRLWDFNPDPTVRLSFWSTIFGRFFISLNYVGTGQTSIQRYSALPTLAKAQLSAALNIPSILFVYTITCLTGLTVYAYYTLLGCDPLANGDISSSNQLLPYFIVDAVALPGISGLFVAVLFSGALSSISSSLNSMAACTWKDFMESKMDKIEEWKKTAINKILVLVYGGIAMIMAFLASGLGGHVLQASQALTGGLGGPSIGMFFLGMFFPFANWQGALFGSLIGFVLTNWISIGAYLHPGSFGRLPTTTLNCTYNDAPSTVAAYVTEMTSSLLTDATPEERELFVLYRLSYMYTSAIGCVVTLICGLVISLFTGGTEVSKVDPKLINPIFDRVCCCIPARLRQRCWCGVSHGATSQNGQNEHGDEKCLAGQNTSPSIFKEEPVLLTSFAAVPDSIQGHPATQYISAETGQGNEAFSLDL